VIEVALVRVHRLELPLVRPFVTSAGRRTRRSIHLVEVRDREGATGWSEIVAEEEPTYWPETPATVLRVMGDHLVPRLAAPLEGPFFVATRFAPVKGNQMAKAALEMAIFDLAARTAGAPLWQLLGASEARATVAGATLSIDEEPGALQEAGYRAVKRKIGPATDPKELHALRERFDGFLSVDANGSLGEWPAAQLLALDRVGLDLVEQPFGAHALARTAALARTFATPLALDESVGEVEDLDTVEALGLRPVLNLKPGRVGGHAVALAMLELQRSRGLGARIGGMLETGIGRAHNLHLGAREECTLPSDLGASERYFAEDLTEPHRLREDGTLPVPPGSGIGVTPLPEALARAETAVAWMLASERRRRR
jgi:O-succinylbenzoate synthase